LEFRLQAAFSAGRLKGGTPNVMAADSARPRLAFHLNHAPAETSATDPASALLQSLIGLLADVIYARL